MDWLMFPNAGAYTMAAASDFNSMYMSKPLKYFVYADVAADRNCQPAES